MKRSHIVLYQAIGWVLVVGYSLLGYDPGTQASASLRYSARELLLFRLAFWLSLLVLFYYCFLLVFPGLLRRRWLAGGLGLLATPLVFAGTRYLLDEVLTPWAFGVRNYYPGTTPLHYLLDNLYFLPPTVVLAGVAVAVRQALLRQQARASELQLQALEQARAQAELAFLRTQINPHFLYNTLNYLYATAYPISEPLAEAVLRLSELMRYLLHESPDGQVALAREVACLDSYLALHRLRFEDKFFVEWRGPTPPWGRSG